jgi:hypothetical protein
MLLAALILSSGIVRAETAYRDLNALGGGRSTFGQSYDGGCTGGSCRVDAPVPAGCADGRCRVVNASRDALSTGGLVTAERKVNANSRPVMSAQVPAPALSADREGAMSRRGGGNFFKKLFDGKCALFGLGGAAVGGGIGFLLGGPIGALIGALAGGLGGLLAAKLLK